MKRKRLNRDAWGFQFCPYYQMRLDTEFFRGTVCLIRLTDGEEQYWDMPKAGKVRVTGAGMTWMELIPDGASRVLTVKYFPDGSHGEERTNYPAPADERFQPSVWYVDVTDGIGTDGDGVAVYVDKYLDVIFTPEGDVKIDDRDELDAAYSSGELSKSQYEAALEECGKILGDWCRDIRATDAWCAKIRRTVEDRIARGEPPTLCREKAGAEGRGMSGTPSEKI